MIVFTDGWPCLNCRDNPTTHYLGYDWCAFHAGVFLDDSPAQDYKELAS